MLWQGFQGLSHSSIEKNHVSSSNLSTLGFQLNQNVLLSSDNLSRNIGM